MPHKTDQIRKKHIKFCFIDQARFKFRCIGMTNENKFNWKIFNDTHKCAIANGIFTYHLSLKCRDKSLEYYLKHTPDFIEKNSLVPDETKFIEP